MSKHPDDGRIRGLSQRLAQIADEVGYILQADFLLYQTLAGWNSVAFGVR
jgi:hypothetical protein